SAAALAHSKSNLPPLLCLSDLEVCLQLAKTIVSGDCAFFCHPSTLTELRMQFFRSGDTTMTKIKTLVASIAFVLALTASAAMAQKPQPGTHPRESCCAMKDCCCKDKDCCKGDSCSKDESNCCGDSCQMKHDKKDSKNKTQ